MEEAKRAFSKNWSNTALLNVATDAEERYFNEVKWHLNGLLFWNREDCG